MKKEEKERTSRTQLPSLPPHDPTNPLSINLQSLLLLLNHREQFEVSVDVARVVRLGSGAEGGEEDGEELSGEGREGRGGGGGEVGGRLREGRRGLLRSVSASSPSLLRKKTHHHRLSEPALHHLLINPLCPLHTTRSGLPVLFLNGEVEGEEGGFEILNGLYHLEAGFDAGLSVEGEKVKDWRWMWRRRRLAGKRGREEILMRRKRLRGRENLVSRTVDPIFDLLCPPSLATDASTRRPHRPTPLNDRKFPPPPPRKKEENGPVPHPTP